MNIQALMKQAQAMQKNMLDAKNKLDQKEFEGNSELVTIKMNGARKILSVKIKQEDLSSDDIEILEDMIQIAFNDVLTQIDKEVEKTMGNQAGPLAGLF